MGISGPENRAGIKCPGVRFLYPLPFLEASPNGMAALC
jgi:hypothetical protein